MYMLILLTKTKQYLFKAFQSLLSLSLQQLTVKQLKRVSKLLDQAMKSCNEERLQCEEERASKLKEVANLLHESVPVSNNEVM